VAGVSLPRKAGAAPESNDRTRLLFTRCRQAEIWEAEMARAGPLLMRALGWLH